jgi:Ca2+-binding RTX toxin-like protein
VSNVEHYKFMTGQAVIFNGNASDNDIWGGSGKDKINGGVGWDDIHGGGGDDELIGGSGEDDLYGDAGADTLNGGTGNDTYWVENAKDVVIEGASGGEDLVYTTVSLAKLFDNVEDAYVLGNGAVNVTGNDLDNSFNGNNAANVFVGGAGKDSFYGKGGNDTLTGGSDGDIFRFNLDTNDASSSGHDTIKDFAKNEDWLSFSDVTDKTNDGNITLDDLLLSITSVVDKGAGKDVDVKFEDGTFITFTGAGTGAVSSIADLVANTAQIEVS